MNVEYYRRCIRYPAEDSPNVALALLQLKRGQRPTGETLVPGMVSWAAYCDGRANLPKMRQSVVLDARWWEGAEQRLVPDEWLDVAVAHGNKLPARRAGRTWLGIDPGEGGDDSAWVWGDRLGVKGVVSLPTPDTNAVFGRTHLIVREWGIAWGDVIFDYGGGGKEHVDRFRASGYPVRGVRFGTIKTEKKRGMTQFAEKRDVDEDTAGYVNRRSEMAYAVRMLLERPAVIDDPLVLASMGSDFERIKDKPIYGLPTPVCNELIRQIAAVPLTWDDLGRFKLIPKSPRADKPDDQNCFKARIGRSPDQFDAFCLMVFGMAHEPGTVVAGSE